MQRRIALIMICLVPLSCATFDVEQDNVSIAQGGHSVTRVAVLNFIFARPEKGRIERGKIERPVNAGEIVADIFTEHLLGTGLYQIVEKERFENRLRQAELSPSDLISSPDWHQFPTLLGVDGIVLGVVSEYGEWRSPVNRGGVSIFTARLVEVSSGNVVWAISANRNMALVNAAAATHAGAASTSQQLREKLAP